MYAKMLMAFQGTVSRHKPITVVNLLLGSNLESILRSMLEAPSAAVTHMEGSEHTITEAQVTIPEKSYLTPAMEFSPSLLFTKAQCTAKHQI
jgi:hypothetical protein